METGRIGKTLRKWNSEVWLREVQLSNYVTGR